MTDIDLKLNRGIMYSVILRYTRQFADDCYQEASIKLMSATVTKRNYIITVTKNCTINLLKKKAYKRFYTYCTALVTEEIVEQRYGAV